jgi:restriction system protein
MAKRPKQQSLLEIAITGNWIVSATFTIVLFIVIYVVIPSVTNPILKPMALAFRSFGLFLMAIFGLMALVKFIGQSKPKNQSNWAAEHNASSEDFKKAFDATFVGVPDSTSPNQTAALIPTAWTLKLIQDIEWKKFEELSTAYYQEKGIRAEATSLGADGGIDIKLYQDGSGNPTSLVQCKAWNSRQVGVKEIREFLGVMTHEKIAKGFYMTSGEYSTDAKGTATANKITLINGEMLLAMIKRLPDASQQKLLALATYGDYTTPSCASCGVKMVKRNGKRGEFWGCKNYPRCKQMLNLKAK